MTVEGAALSAPESPTAGPSSEPQRAGTPSGDATQNTQKERRENATNASQFFARCEAEARQFQETRGRRRGTNDVRPSQWGAKRAGGTECLHTCKIFNDKLYLKFMKFNIECHYFYFATKRHKAPTQKHPQIQPSRPTIPKPREPSPGSRFREQEIWSATAVDRQEPAKSAKDRAEAEFRPARPSRPRAPKPVWAKPARPSLESSKSKTTARRSDATHRAKVVFPLKELRVR